MEIWNPQTSQINFFLISEVSPEDEKSREEETVIVVELSDDKSTTSSDSESTTDKETEPDHIPDEEEEIPDINIPVKPADDESTTSSDKESTADDEERPEESSEISTVETIVVEKTHSQVSTTITEISAKNPPNYPIDDVVPAMEDSPITDEAPINTQDVLSTEKIPIEEDFQKTESEVPESAPVTEEYEGLVYEISPADEFQEIDKLHAPTILTNERESQTEDRDVYNETTQTDYTTRGTTRDAFSMTPTR